MHRIFLGVEMINIPDQARTAQAAQIPTKPVSDWEKLYATIQREQWIVLDVPVEELRLNKSGTMEAPAIKCLISYASNHKLPGLSVRRMTDTRWFVSMRGTK